MKDPNLMTEEELSAIIEAMPPTSGLTSIPLGAPWPPLSREQVVKLHEALVEFCEKLDLRRGSWMDARVAWRLREAIRGMGIGSPPPSRTWTHEEVAKVAEEVQDGANLTPVEPAWLRLDWGSVQMPVRNLSGQDLAEGQIVTTAQVQVAPQKRNCWTCRHSLGEPGGWLCNTHNIEVLLWLGKPENSIGLREDGQMMPKRTTDGCPGWERKP